jgi:hypothetical protein
MTTHTNEEIYGILFGNWNKSIYSLKHVFITSEEASVGKLTAYQIK